MTTHTLEVWGDLACFTRPEMKVERFSYPVITPSAARGIFDAIYWDGKREQQGRESVMRPYFHWQITRIEVLEMPRYIALRRNEVKDRVPGTATLNRWMDGPDWGKMNSQFQRRAKAGKCFQQPYFGCREFPAFFEYIEDPATSPSAPASLDQHLGFMLYDVFDLSREAVKDNDKPFITVFDASLVGGVLDVPPFGSDAVKKPGRT